MTGFDWEAYNEGCQKVISAIQYAKFTELGERTIQMAKLSYPVDANGMAESSTLSSKSIQDILDDCKWWDSYIDGQDYRV